VVLRSRGSPSSRFLSFVNDRAVRESVGKLQGICRRSMSSLGGCRSVLRVRWVPAWRLFDPVHGWAAADARGRWDVGGGVLGQADALTRVSSRARNAVDGGQSALRRGPALLRIRDQFRRADVREGVLDLAVGARRDRRGGSGRDGEGSGDRGGGCDREREAAG